MHGMDPEVFTGFDWDTSNQLKSQLKHRVTQQEAEDMFLGVPLVVADTAHSGVEPRFHALGQSRAGRHLLAVFTLRGERIRIISVRNTSRRERQVYEKKREQAPPVR